MKRIAILAASLGLLLCCLLPSVAVATDTADPVAQVLYELDPASYSVDAGTPSSGTLASTHLHDAQYLEVAAAAAGDGYEAAVVLEFTNGYAMQALNAATLRVCLGGGAEGVQVQAYVYDWANGSYAAVAAEAAWTGVKDLPLPGPSAYLSAEGGARVKLVCTADAAFALQLDQLQLLLDGRQPGGAVRVTAYGAAEGVLETGTLSDGTGFSALADRDGVNLSVASASNKAAWHAIVPLYQPRQDVRTIMIHYAGRTSVATNDIWLSLYRFDTQNWEAVSVLPGTTDTTALSVVLSGSRLQSYLSADGDLQIRLYNSATGSFVRHTDYLSVSVYSDVEHSQEVSNAVSVYTEYGSSTGAVSAVHAADGVALVTQSNADNKAAVQLTYEVAADLSKVEALSFALSMKSETGINAQYISLLNHETGRFSVVKTVSGYGGGVFETVHVTLDSLNEIRKYVNADGEIVLRIYNSASGSFVRELDLAQLTVTYGTFESFTIAQVSDVHELIGSENFRAIISELNEDVQPAFTVISGDITDHGTPAQYAKYLEDAALFDGPVYTIPGNHDVRWWNADGKSTFTSQVGPLYQSVNYGGVHFVFLDSTVNFELDGKLNPAQRAWLEADLAAVPADMPVIWFTHHPFKINNNVTARHELLSLAEGHNVIALMSGHVHYYGNVVEDGIPVNYITYVKDNANREYVTIEFTPNYYYIYKHKASDGSRQLWLSGRMDNTRRLSFDITGVQVSGDTVTVTASVEHAPDGVVSMQARIDNYGSYTQLALQADGTWRGSIDTTAYHPTLVPGAHFVGVEAFDANGNKWTQYADYATGSTQAEVAWVFETGDTIQSSATIAGDAVYAGSNDGFLYCLNAATGAENWKYQTGGCVISKPALTAGGNVVFGSEDGKVYCLNAATGQLAWSYETGGAVLSDPLVDGNAVYIGCGDGKIYCLNAQTGAAVWTYQTDGLMRQRPVVQDGVLYAFVRDTYIWYALNAANGQLVWRGNANTDESLFVCGDVRPLLAGGKLWCIDAQNTRPGYLNLQTGALDWTGTLGNVSSRGMATDGTLVFCVSNSGRQLTAYRADTAAVAWEKDLRYNNADSDLQQMQIDSGLVYENGLLFHVAERGRVTALDPDDGTIVWQLDIAGFPERVFWSTPEVQGDLLVACGIDGKVYAVTYGEE